MLLRLLPLLQVHSSGLSAKADNVASWKQQLSTWQGSITDRMQQLEATQHGRGCAIPADARRIMAAPRLVPQPLAAAAAAARPAAAQQQPSAVLQRNSNSGRQQQPSARLQRQPQGRAAAAATAVAAPAATAAGALAARAAISKEDERLRQMIMGEILERRRQLISTT
ncbi:hypothetical protein COO60DRAFT_945376 [Scenedesmus sp. NREL 46B-D3]|nr:hypothetical protein COO60DRAFT_945376 [Scenedesmus sp. NREL 46B-D3]